MASADGYALFSKHEEMKAHVVVDAGDFEEIRPTYGRIGATVLLRLNSNCFQPMGSWPYRNQAGLVLVNKDKSLRLALIEASVGGIKVESVPALRVACPSDPPIDSLLESQQQLDEIRRQQELMRLQLERLRQQRP